MLGEQLTGLCADERASVELTTDKGTTKTVYVIQNGAAWVDLEVGRIAHQWERLGYDEAQAVSYAWVSLCLIEMHNVNKVGDVVTPPRTETFTVRTGEKAQRIPLEWLVKTFGKRYRTIDELSSAIYCHNHLTGAERKNWTWQDGSTKPAEAATCPASDQAQTTLQDTQDRGVSVVSSDSKQSAPAEGESTTASP